jgi:hypothetical protein
MEELNETNKTFVEKIFVNTYRDVELEAKC